MVKDSYLQGILTGLVIPFVGFFGFYKWKFSAMIIHQKSILSSMISVSLLLNGAVLTFFFQKEKDKTAKGIFIITCIYALVAIACKWFL
jgi:NADH:ubiquinone oxidoreductase subunit K